MVWFACVNVLVSGECASMVTTRTLLRFPYARSNPRPKGTNRIGIAVARSWSTATGRFNRDPGVFPFEFLPYRRGTETPECETRVALGRL